MLLFQKPELAYIQNVDEEIPLHWAVRQWGPSEVIKLLLSVHPSSACFIKDKDGNTALSLVWERCESSLFDIWWRWGQQWMGEYYALFPVLFLLFECATGQ